MEVGREAQGRRISFTFSESIPFETLLSALVVAYGVYDRLRTSARFIEVVDVKADRVDGTQPPRVTITTVLVHAKLADKVRAACVYLPEPKPGFVDIGNGALQPLNEPRQWDTLLLPEERVAAEKAAVNARYAGKSGRSLWEATLSLLGAEQPDQLEWAVSQSVAASARKRADRISDVSRDLLRLAIASER